VVIAHPSTTLRTGDDGCGRANSWTPPTPQRGNPSLVPGSGFAVDLSARLGRTVRVIIGRRGVGADGGSSVEWDKFADGVGEGVDQAASVGQLVVQFAAATVTGRLQVFEADAGRGQLGGHRDAQELVAVEDPDLG